MQQIDRDKVQLAVYNHFNSLVEEAGCQITPNNNDLIAARFLVFESLHYSAKGHLAEFFGLDEEEITHEQIYNKLAALSDDECSFMIRTALAGKPEGKYPSNLTGYFLYQTAAAAGVNVDQYEAEQLRKAAARQARQAEKIKAFEKKIAKIQEKST